ncbi:MAG: GntR family transcriptional regulator [Oscillospiraceae bacterium]|nr:GntR family transcriptional regulator [Oscillospiraceae bacterium]
MIRLDLQSRLPIYEQLKNKIGELVLLGELKPDDQLPSVRNFARELGINPNTVQKAYQDLERDKIIYSVAGRGSYISPDIDVTKQLHEQQIQKVKSAVMQAKACNLSKDQIIDAVYDVYGRDTSHDSGNGTYEKI